MEIGSNLSESQENVSAQPELKENVSVQEPIYKTKDGQTVTKSQLIDSGYSEDRINKGIDNKVLSLVGDTQHPEQKFTTKDGQTVTTKQLIESGYSQGRIDKGISNGILSPYIEKKKDNLESSGATPQEVSPTPTATKKSLLVGESPKKPSAWDTLAGKSSDVSLGGFKINKPIVGATKTKTQKLETAPNVDFSKMTVDQLIDFGKGDEVTYQAPVLASAFGGGVLKTKMSPQLKPQFDNFLRQNYQSALQKIKPYVLKKEDLNSIEDDYKEAQSGGSWLDKAGSYAKSLLSNISMEEDEVGDRNKVVKPLDDIRKEVRDEAIHNKETLLPGQVEYRVKQKFIEKRTKEINQTKMNAAKEDLTPAEQYSYGLHKAEQASHLSKENKEKTKNYYETLSNSKSLLDDKEQLVKEYNEMKANKTPIPQEYIDRYKDNEHNIALNLGLAKVYKTEINKNLKDIGTFEQEAAAYTSENNELLDIIKRIQSYGYSFMGGVHEFAAKYIDKPISIISAATIPSSYIAGLEKSDIGYSEEYAKKAQDIKEGKEGIIEGVRLGGTTKTLSLNSANDYVNELVSIVGDNAGMTAALLAGGTPGLVATTIESTGNKVKEIRNENEEFKKAREEAVKNKEGNFEFNGEKYNTKEYANKDLHSEVASYLVPAAWGATMVLPMAGQLKFLQNEARIAAAIEKQSPELIQKTLMQKSKDWTKQYIGHSLGLARDLKVMSLFQAGLDNSLGKEVNYFKVATDLKGVRDAFILHGMNAGFAHVLGQTARPYMTNKEAKIIDDNARLISYLNDRLKSEELTPESKGLVKKQLDRLTVESKVHIDNTIDRMSNMSDADYTKVIDLANKSSDLRQEAMDTQNSNLNIEEKQKALDKIKEDYLENEKVLKYTKENYTPRTDGFFGLPDREQGKLMDRASKELISDAKSKGEREFNFSDRDIKLKSQEIFSRDNSPKEEVVPTPEVKAEEVVTPTEEVTPKGTEDEISQPIELEVPKEEIIEIPQDELEALKEDVNRAEEEGTLSSNVGEKVYRGNEEGVIEIEGQQYIFRTGDKIHELGNVDEVADNNLASLGISVFPPEGIKTEPIIEGEKANVISVDGKEYTFVRQRRPKKGETVLVLKEKETGLQKAFKGDKAERILKDISLQKPQRKTALNLKVEGKEVPTEPIKSKGELKREKRADKIKAKKEFEEKTMAEIEKMQKELEEKAAQVEKDLLDTIAKESKKENRLLFNLKGKDFAVTKKSNNEYSVSQKNKEGKYVGIKDEASRSKAIEEFNSIKEGKDSKRLKDAEDLSNEYRKEQTDKILAFLDKAIEGTNLKGKLFDGTLGLPLFVINSGLKTIRAAYKAGKGLAEAIAEGYKFLKEEGYGISEHDFKKYVLENINKAEVESKTTEVKTPELETKSRSKRKPKATEVEEPKAETEKKVSLPSEAVEKMNELLKNKKQQEAILKKLIAEGRIEQKPCNI